jgi:serine/threonine protein kinase
MHTPSIRSGMNIGGYDLIRPLGSGGAATIYEALHPSLGRVALKLLHACPSDAAHAEQARARFLREARAASLVRHAHVSAVAKLHSAGIVHRDSVTRGS